MTLIDGGNSCLSVRQALGKDGLRKKNKKYTIKNSPLREEDYFVERGRITLFHTGQIS
jgi:hypothetical protein